MKQDGWGTVSLNSKALFYTLFIFEREAFFKRSFVTNAMALHA